MNQIIVLLGKRLLLVVLFVLLSFLGVAQYGPFGIGNADGGTLILPDQVVQPQPRLLLWLDGSEVVRSGSAVTQWTDKSGNDHHFVQTVAAERPIFQASGGPGGSPCISFDGIDDRLECPSFELPNGGYSVYVVFKSNDTNFGLFSYSTASAGDTARIYFDSGLKQSWGASVRSSNITSGEVLTNQWEYAGMLWNGSTSGVWEYTDGRTNEPGSSFPSSPSPQPFSVTSGSALIGDIPDQSGGFQSGTALDGEIAEIIIWEGFMSRQIARMMRTYLWTKYGGGSSANNFREGNAGWDKFHGYNPTSTGGQYYAPIGIGKDTGTNAGDHSESRSNGLILRVRETPNEWLNTRTYLNAAQVTSGPNTIVSGGADLPVGVDARWSRIWEIATRDGGQNFYRIAFDFGEGINGLNPQAAENFVLLRRTNPTSGTFSVVPVVSQTTFNGDELEFRVTGGTFGSTRFYYTIGTTNSAISSLDGSLAKTWYAFQTGDWDQPTTWTLDGSSAPSYINPSDAIPSAGDNVEIGSGRTVTIPTALPALTQGRVRVDGTLNIGTSSRPDFSTVTGSGIIRCAGDNFPNGNMSDFADASTGGLVEFYGSVDYSLTNDIVANKIQVNFSNASRNVTLAADLTHNGLMEIKRGRLTINDASNVTRTINSNDDVLVESQGDIYVSSTSGARVHNWNFMGDLINNGGDVRFTNRTVASTTLYNTNETQHYINARFINGSENQELRANGITYMSRIVINKGNDLTYELSISANIADRFRLLGHCDDDFDAPFSNESQNSNSCALINGTLRVKENIFIPLHSSGGNYCINETARLWVDGGIVVKGANSQGAAFGPSVGTSNSQAIVPYGEVKVTGGMLNAWCTSGLTTRANGLIVVEGGQINTNAIRTSVQGPSNIGGILISGGEVNVNGNLPGGANNSYYTFSLTYPGNLFRMTGGVLRVAGPSSRGLIFINSDPEQTSVTGGTVIAQVVSTETTHRISSRAPFWNLEIERLSTSTTNRPVIITGGDSFGEIIPDQPLIVKNSLHIRGTNAPTLQMTSTTSNPNDLRVEGDFRIDNGGIYDHGLNTTYFEGDANTILNFPTINLVTFNNLVVDKATSSRFVEIQQGETPVAIEVEGEFRLENGFFENNARTIDFKGDVVIRSNFGTATSTGIARMAGLVSQTLTSQNGVFHNFRINNPNGVTLENGDLEIRREMRFEDGIFFIQNHKVRIASSTGVLSISGVGATQCFATDGSASAGGLEIINRLDGQQLTFPVGVEDGLGGAKYTPAFVRINGGWVDEGFIRVVPVDELLPTVDPSGGVDRLAFYWRVLHSEYENIPNVSHRFIYDDSDILGDENEFAAGRVLSELPFTRSFDFITTEEDHVTTSNNSIYFNGPEAASTNLAIGPGTPIVNADYSAGNWGRFVGQPEVYFSRSTTLNADWTDELNWRSLTACGGCSTPAQYHSPAPVSAGGGFPGAGDIAFIGFDPTHPNFKPHLYLAPVGGVQAILVGFTPMQADDPQGTRQPRWNSTNANEIGLLRPTLSFGNTSQISSIGQISGEGALLLTGAADLNAADIGNFLKEDSSIVVLQPATASLTLNSFPSQVPNLFVTSGPNGSLNATSTIQANIVVRGDLEIAGNANLGLWDGVEGDVFIFGDLKLGRYSAGTSGPQMLFSALNNERSVEVLGNVLVSGNGAVIQIVGPNTTAPTLVHEFIAWQDILQNAPSSTGLNFYTGANRDFISLTLRGAGNHEFTNSAGNVPNLGRLILDKGTSIASSFNFNGDVNIDGPSNLPEKPVDLRNGLLTFDHPNIDITLSSGGGNFVIPNTAGLVLGNGNLDIISDQTGLILDGLLRIDGGTFSLGDTEGENNFIEYSAGGQASLEVTGGTLIIGSQLRMGLTNTSGILDYRQSGGNVIIGRYAAPSTSRPVFEVRNIGSRFDHTGGTLTIVRGINNTTAASLLLDPDNHNIGVNSEIIIGSGDTPSSGPVLKNFGIQSAIALNDLTIDNSSGANPEVRLQVLDLTLNGLLSIDIDSELDCRNRDLVLRDDLINNGTLKSASGEVILEHSGAIPFSVSGLGTYDLFDLTRTGGGITNIDSDLLVNNNFTQDDGTIDFDANSITVRGDAEIDGSLLFNTSSNGLVFNGVGSQFLRRSGPGSSIINTITINNGSGVEMIAGAGYTFIIDNKLRLSRGVFDLAGNLLIINEDARFEALNSYGENNMISTGGAFTNFGVQVFIPNNSVEERIIPLGIDRYMPISMKFSDEFGNTAGYSSGNNPDNSPSSYLFKLNIPEHPVIVEDVETVPPLAISDAGNVLQMYFSVDADNIGPGLRMDMDFQYDDQYVNTTGGPDLEESDYIAARVFTNAANNDIIQKFSDPAAVDEGANLIRFTYDDLLDGSGDEEDIDGDYFAGINNAIPEKVPVYETSTNMDVDQGNLYTLGTVDTPPLGPGDTPRGARVNILDTDVLTVSSAQSIDFFRTDIAPGATLVIDGPSIHRLGRVTGSGTIRLRNTGQLPSGNYNDFFVCNAGFGGKLEYQGTGGTVDVLANLPLVEKVDFTGTGTMRISNNDVEICTDLTINGPQVIANSNSLLTVDGDLILESNGILDLVQGDLLVRGNTSVSSGADILADNRGTSTFEGDVVFDNSTSSIFDLGDVSRETRIKGDFTKLGATGAQIAGGTGGAQLIFEGISPQTITGNFTGANRRIPYLKIQNSAGLTIAGNVEVNDTLALSLGNINTSNTNRLILANDGVDIVPEGGSAISYVNGPMDWVLSSGNSERIFPLGKDDPTDVDDRYRPLEITQRSATRTWTAEYFNGMARDDLAQVTTMIPADQVVIKEVSIQEYWIVNSNTTLNTNARIGLSWGNNSAVSPNPVDYQKLVVLAYDEGADLWDSYGALSSSFSSPTGATGSFESENVISFSERIITLGSRDAINPLPVTWLYFDGETDGNHHTLSWATASEQNNEKFILERSIDAQNWSMIAEIEGAGNSNVTKYYEFTDRVAPFGIAYYRIKQVDYDGALEYAPNVVSLEKKALSVPGRLDFVIYPNPNSAGVVRLLVTDLAGTNAIVLITDISGKTLSEELISIDGQGISQEIDCNFNPGIYLVSIISNERMNSKRLVITK